MELWLHQIRTYITKNTIYRFIGKEASLSANSDNRKNAEYQLC